MRPDAGIIEIPKVSPRGCLAERAKADSLANLAEVGEDALPIALTSANMLSRAVGAVPMPVVSGREPEIVKDGHDPVATGTKRHPLVPDFPKFDSGPLIADQSEGAIAGALAHGPPR